MSTAPRIELDEVQGNVLHAYGVRFPAARYAHLKVRDAGAARAALGGWTEQVTFGRRRDADAHVNLAFTYAGLAALGIDEEVLATFPDDFRAGARARSPAVDGDASATEAWEEGLGRSHVLLVVHARGEDACRERLVALLAEAGDDAFVESAAQQPAALLNHDGDDDVSCGTRYSREHFGFADGCSQPAVAGVDDDPEGDGLLARMHPKRRLHQILQDVGLRKENRDWRPVRAGEFLLGYENEDGRLPAGPPDPLGPNGTFLVYRKIEQHVDVFKRHLAAEARRLEMPAPELEARVLGRWQDGTPLDRSPGREEPRIATDRHEANVFTYADDPGGRKCPLGAHVRRTNPRNGLPGGAEMTMRHRIIRRGMPYAEAGGVGLVFIAYNSSIKEGFETIQRFWCHDGAALGLGGEPDYLLQQPRDGKPLSGMVVNHDPANPQRIDPPREPFVTVRGCEYLFLPSRRGCAWMSGR